MAAPIRFLVRYRREGGAWQEQPVTASEVILGRASGSDLRLDDLDVSRRHARLTLTPDGLWLTDLGSTNGTQIDGKPLPPRKQVALAPGQPFTLGPFTVAVQLLPAVRPSIPPPPEAAAPRPASPTVLIPADPPPVAGPVGGDHTLAGSALAEPPTAPRPVQIGAAEKTSLGRAEDNAVVLDHPLVSRYHASVERLGSRFRLQDLRSTNGVFVNGTRIEREAWLQEGDEVRIGPYALILTGARLEMQAEEGLGITARGLHQHVSPRVDLLQDLSLTINPQEFVALVGMSGAGKSTLLNALSGYRPATAGQVLVNDLDLYRHYDLFRNEIGYVPQRDIVHLELTPEHALDYAAQLRMPPDTTPAERRARVQEVLADLGLLERKDVPIARLSGGQLKRVSIGVELLTKPRLFFLDEPSSGLDPGTEYEMMRLLRRLADQGRTVLLVTHATKNVMLCDKVVFMARGGFLAYYGPPEGALAYFDSYRTAREQREKEIEFDDIYRILSDSARGGSAEWGARYRASAAYGQYAVPDAGLAGAGATAGPAAPSPGNSSVAPAALARRPHISPGRQLAILSARNLKIIFQDKVSLALMLAIAPILGVLQFAYGATLFDPVVGDAGKTITVWFMVAVVTLLVGALGSVREIVKEVDIYRRERAVNLQIVPYVLSKVWVGVVLALYQAAVLMVFLILMNNPRLPDAGAYGALYGTMFLSIVCGYLLGLTISAATANQNAALLLIVAALVPQFIFAGALLSLDLIPGGEWTSRVMPTRWVFESLVRTTGVGDTLAADPCWARSKEERRQLTEAQKADCPCMGANVFTQCVGFPGVQSPDFYTAAARRALATASLAEPPEPTALPSPTPLPTPRPPDTPTPLPLPPAPPPPSDPRLLPGYLATVQEQGQEYQTAAADQLAAYFQARQDQTLTYLNDRQHQGEEYAAARQHQGQEYAEAMRAYGNMRADREKAIGSAEALLSAIYDNYGRALKGTVAERWGILLTIMAGLLALILFFQRRKDVV
jgi:ABC-type multidrug transport system ATPase subunit/pSer/pThr/pTyr-binding forkhead associated (FHA) protein